MTPRFRPDLVNIEPYRPGRSIADVAAEFGIDQISKLASNENPEPPFPEVQQAIAAHVDSLNRYPDNAKPMLTAALAEHLGVPADRGTQSGDMDPAKPSTSNTMFARS